MPSFAVRRRRRQRSRRARFFVGALGLPVGLLVTGTRELGLSALATLPVFVGMSLGRRMRIALNERQFALLLLTIYVVIGTTFLLKGLA